MAGFSLPLDKYAEKTKLRLEDAARRISFEIFKAVVLKTPVGNPSTWKSRPPPGYVGGRLRGNWRVSFGAIDGSTDNNKVGTGTGGIPERALALPVGGVVYLSNSLPYARRVENGWSHQAPQGMVRTTVVEYQQFVKKVLGS